MSNEEDLSIRPAVKILKKNNIKVSGPHPADTFFIKENISKYDSIVGMYHDQVLTPFKTIFEFDMPILLWDFIFELSVDHGPNNSMMGKNKSNTES